jgi:hypothetical protein
MRNTTLLACAATLAACGEQNVTVGDFQEVLVLPAVPSRNLDILFVIDTSPSMLDEQEALVASFPRMMDSLSTLQGGLPNLHIGVITTDMGVQNSNGVLPPDITDGPVGPGACVGVGDDGALRSIVELAGVPYISDVEASDGTRVQNFTGALRDVFGTLATVGANGCGFEQPLAAVRRALDNPLNAGFVRADANLAVIIISDEDDCSAAHHEFFTIDGIDSFQCTKFGVTCDNGGATPDAMAQTGAKSDCHENATSTLIDDVAPYVDMLVDLKQGDPYRVMVAAIVGNPEPVSVELRAQPGSDPIAMVPMLSHACSSQLGWADPAVRIARLVDAFHNRGVVTSICDSQLELPLTSIGHTAKKLMGDPCVDVALVRPSCSVLDGPVGEERPMQACDSDTADNCWRLVSDESLCSMGADHLRLEVLRSQSPLVSTYAHLRCLTP